MKMLRDLKRHDLVFLRKKLVSPVKILALRKLSLRLKFRCLVRHADLVIAGNRVLADYTSNFHENVVIIPSAVKADGVPIRDHEKENDEVVIGWIGSKGNLHHFKMLSPVLQRLAKEYCFRLQVICSESVEIPGVTVKFVPWSVETQERDSLV